MTIDLDTLRKQLDSVDSQIVKLLEERFLITDRVALYKDKHNIPLTDRNREHEVLEKIRDTLSHGILKENISEIYEKIFVLNKTARRFKQIKNCPFQKIGVIGLGLIGGSIVKAIKMKQPEIDIYTVKRKSDDTALAVKQGYIKKELDSIESLATICDLIILASPIDSIIPLAKKIAESSPSNELIVIDVASVKGAIAKEFEKLTSGEISFIPTHPMAGSEKMGFENTQGMLFVDKPWIICSHKKTKPDQEAQIKKFITFLGSKPHITTAKTHDAEVATISHVVFLLSCYLFAFVSEKHQEALKLAGSGFESITRLASGSPEMHTQIITQNYEHCMVRLMELLEFMKKDSLTPDTLLSFFRRTKKARDRYIQDRS